MTIKTNTDVKIDAENKSTSASKVLSLLAIGAGISAPGVVQAELIVTDINHTVDETSFAFNIGDDFMSQIVVGHHESASSEFGYLFNKYGRIDFSADGKFVDMFSAGDTVDATSFNGTNSGGEFFRDETNADYGFWDNLGAHGYVGFKFDDGTGNGDRFGWLEITRGSVIIGSMGLQSDYGVGAAIPNEVPEPGTMLLLASGALGLMGMRRRNKTAQA
mgnify:CR=1 FL=1